MSMNLNKLCALSLSLLAEAHARQLLIKTGRRYLIKVPASQQLRTLPERRPWHRLVSVYRRYTRTADPVNQLSWWWNRNTFPPTAACVAVSPSLLTGVMLPESAVRMTRSGGLKFHCLHLYAKGD